ncbi:MAG: hypothetical protein OQJ97_09555 [Rhodospirillales bacterium]|nr:hypothetical protein [Rhodospirillales bacterium]
MDAKTKTICLLIPLTFLWFLIGIINGFFLPFMFKAYSEAEVTNFFMQVTIVSLIFMPMTCVTTVIGGWRLFISERYSLAVKVALIPFPVGALVVWAYQAAGWP